MSEFNSRFMLSLLIVVVFVLSLQVCLVYLHTESYTVWRKKTFNVYNSSLSEGNVHRDRIT